MKSPMQTALGADWDKLPPALQAHYHVGRTLDCGWLDIEYPRWMQPFLSALRCLGALVDRPGQRVATVVDKRVAGERQFWRRTLTYADGRQRHFNSIWTAAENGLLIEYVNPVLGLQMAPRVEDGRLCYSGVRFVAKFGRWRLPIPEWLVLGHAVIVEEAVDDRHFVMDFRMIHPLFGQLFRYGGEFEVIVVPKNNQTYRAL
jgi:hypothetical protein